MTLMSALNNSASPERLVINLLQRGDEVSVRSVEVVDPVKRIRFSFSRDQTIERIFKPNLHVEISRLVESARLDGGLLSMPDYAMHVEGLMLRGFRVLGQAQDNGSNRVMIRAQSYFGRITAMFRDDVNRTDEMCDKMVDVSTEIITDLVVPLRDIAAYMDRVITEHPNAFAPEIEHHLANIKVRMDELNFFSDMLSQFVNNQVMLRAAEAELSAIEMKPG